MCAVCGTVWIVFAGVSVCDVCGRFGVVLGESVFAVCWTVWCGFVGVSVCSV